ncbi:MAG TPA: VOC family protein [Puia sp.]|jgi:PhnB protein|nr:VOC family protein [Puia sp.]
MKLSPYLNFDGNAEEAVEFYKTALDGEVVMLTRFGESPVPSADDEKQKIMHARIVFGGDNIIMISDTLKGSPFSTNGNIQLSIGLDDEAKTNQIFNKLSEGGKVVMPVAKQFWGDIFGMLQDKFGVNWMLNCTTTVSPF